VFYILHVDSKSRASKHLEKSYMAGVKSTCLVYKQPSSEDKQVA
jgi:hypothetical protein